MTFMFNHRNQSYSPCLLLWVSYLLTRQVSIQCLAIKHMFWVIGQSHMLQKKMD